MFPTIICRILINIVVDEGKRRTLHPSNNNKERMVGTKSSSCSSMGKENVDNDQRPKRPNGSMGSAILRPKQFNKKISPSVSPTISPTISPTNGNISLQQPTQKPLSRQPPPAPAQSNKISPPSSQTNGNIRDLWFQLIPPVDTTTPGRVGTTTNPPSTASLSTYRHVVRDEPLMEAETVGYLLPHLAVLAQAVVGDWAKVRYHKKRTTPPNGTTQPNAPPGGLRADGWGWCLMRDPLHTDRTFLKSTSMTHASPPPAVAAAVTKDKNKVSRNSKNNHGRAFNEHGSNDEIEEDEETQGDDWRDSGDNEMNVSQVDSHNQSQSNPGQCFH